MLRNRNLFLFRVRAGILTCAGKEEMKSLKKKLIAKKNGCEKGIQTLEGKRFHKVAIIAVHVPIQQVQQRGVL